MSAQEPAAAEATTATARSEPVAPQRSYLVCATPRSGSTLLCETLEQTGIAGRPREYFEALKETGVPRRPREYFWGLRSPEVLRLLPHDAQLDRDSERVATWNRDDYARHLDASIEQGTTANGVFGAKMMWGYFDDFLELTRGIPRFGGMGDGSLLNAAFPDLQYVFVSRSDKVRQAVSLWRALQTWVWRKAEGHADDEPLPEQRAVYSFDAIDHLLDQLRRHEDAWRGFFFRIGRRPLTVLYEEVAGDLDATVERILRELRLERPPGSAAAAEPMRRQSDELSESWVQNYLEDVSRR
jgi:trehalose 2-sulfotransferase